MQGQGKATFKSWQVGEIFLDLYQVQESLGENSEATLYKVRHLGWNIDLMVKVPQAKIFQTIGGPDNFVAHMKAWVDLGLHPHIVTCYYVRTVENIPLLFTEYVDGDSLHDRIRHGTLYQGGGQQSLQRILDIAIQSAWGLHYIHEQNTIHGSIRPSNVLLNALGLAKVTDLGMNHGAMIAASLENSGQHHLDLEGNGAMTPAYCSPEQAKHQPLTPGSDSWSWGLLLLEMFQGQRTWSVGTSAASALKHYQEHQQASIALKRTQLAPASAGELPPMPGEVGWLLRRCFRKDPCDRPSFLELASELQTIYQSATGLPYPRFKPSAGKETPESLNNKALAYLDLGKQSLALQLWEQALEIQPSHPDCHYNRGLLLWRTGRIHDNALIGKLEKLQRSATGTELIDYLLASVHLERDDCDRALELLHHITPQSIYRPVAQAALELAQERSPDSIRLVRTFEDHTNLIKSVCFSADGRYVLSGCNHNNLKLWETQTGECVRTFTGHTQEVKCVAISGDSQYALSASWDKTLKLWDVNQGTCLRSFQPHEHEIFTICLSFDGVYALSGSDDRFNLWQIQTVECLQSFAGHKGDIFSLALSPDGKYALSGSLDTTIKLWDVKTGTCLQTLHGHSREVTSVCLSLDGEYALSGSSDQTLKLWQLSTGQCVKTLSGHTSEVTSVCLTADGQMAISGSSDHTLKLWQLSTGRCLRTFSGHTSAVTSICLSPDNAYVLSGSMDDTLKLWSVKPPSSFYQAPMRLSSEPIADPEANLPSLPQKSTKYTGEYTGEIPLVTALISQRNYIAAAQQLRKLRAACSKDFSLSLSTYFSAWRQLYLCLPRKGLIGAYPVEDLTAEQVPISAVALSQDGRYAVSAASLDRFSLNLWTLSSGRSLRTFEGHTNLVESVCLNANSTQVLSGSADKTVKLWAVATGLCTLTLTGHSCGVTSVCFSADGRYAISGSSDRTIKFWEIATGQCLYTFKGHYAPVTALCVSPDGRYLLSGSADTTIKIWHLTQQKCLYTFKGHLGTVTALSISADGCVALSGSTDKTLKLWHITELKCLQTLVGHTDEVTSVCLTLDGRYAVSGSRDETVKIWQVNPKQCLHTFTGLNGAVNSVAADSASSYLLSGSASPVCSKDFSLDNRSSSLKLWQLDWELADCKQLPWDERGRPYLESFLMLHSQKTDRPVRSQDFSLSLSDGGNDIPTWTDADFNQLLYTLGCAGYGWLEPEGVRTQLETMAANWQWLSPFISEVPDDLDEEGTQLVSFFEPDSEAGTQLSDLSNGDSDSDESSTQLAIAPPVRSQDFSLYERSDRSPPSPPLRKGETGTPLAPRTSGGTKSTVALTIESGSLKGRTFVFDSRSVCAIGRGKECDPQLPNDSSHQTISRYHCLLDINPPGIRIRDLNSKNGTFVNGKMIGKGTGQNPPREWDIHHGDRIKLGFTCFRVQIDPGQEAKAVGFSAALGGTLEPSPAIVSPLAPLKTPLGTGELRSPLPMLKGYTTIEFLGQGRLSQVYSVQNNETGQVFALKIVRPQITPTQEAIEAFQRDLENLKALNHPNIVKLYDYGYWDDRFFLLFDYCPGGSVAKVMQHEGKPLSIEQSLAIILKVLDALDAAHNLEVPYLTPMVIHQGQGLLHGNLKPTNIFLVEENLANSPPIKLGDYGLDKAFDLLGFSGQTMTGANANRPIFIPRQQAINLKYIQTDGDIWAAAATLYFMLTGRFAREFSGVDPLLTVLHTSAIPIRDRYPEIPKALAELIDLALVDKPHIHFKKACSFKRALEAVF